MSEAIKAGDVVTLKSTPSPHMTVEQISGTSATCIWFIDSEYQTQNIDIVALKKVTL